MFKFLRYQGNTVIFALATALSNTLRVAKSIMNPKLLGGLPIHEDVFTRNWEETVTLCDKECPVTYTGKVQITFSGPLASKAKKLEMLAELVEIINSSDGQSVLDGFPANPNTTFTVT